MQVRTLYKKLGEMIQNGEGYKKVVINKNTFTNPLESDGCVMLEVRDLEFNAYPILNDDGGLGHGENDDEKYEFAVILSGEKRVRPMIIKSQRQRENLNQPTNGFMGNTASVLPQTAPSGSAS